MIDILILILLCLRIRKIVKPKGYNATNWIIRTVAVWLLCEMIGITISFLLQRDFWIMNLSGFLCAIGGYLFIQNKAMNLPDNNKSKPWDPSGDQQY